MTFGDTITDRVAAARRGDIRAIARLVSMVEGGGADAAVVARELTGLPRRAQVIGMTGAPGAGKSTLTAALLRHFRGDVVAADGTDAPAHDGTAGACDTRRTVAVLAVDPSSPLTGGALLGDRVRMAEHVTDRGVFIRSLSSRGNLGGLSTGTPAAVDLMSALGFDVVIIETVGVGQSEVDVMNLADSVAVVLAPGMGDAVQAAKAGIMEIADIIVVNKADHEGARTAVRELRAMVALGAGAHTRPGQWRPPVLPTEAHRDVGVAGLVTAFADHARHLAETGGLAERQRARAAAAVESVVMERLRRALTGTDGRDEIARAATAVMGGELDAHRAADTVLSWLSASQAADG